MLPSTSFAFQRHNFLEQQTSATNNDESEISRHHPLRHGVVSPELLFINDLQYPRFFQKGQSWDIFGTTNGKIALADSSSIIL